jgi:hypothetical protein
MTILLLHAFPLDSRMWDEHRAALEAAGHTPAEFRAGLLAFLEGLA